MSSIQVGFICLLVVLHTLYQKFFADLVVSLHRGLAYGLGGIACFWFLERFPSLLAVA